MQQTIKTRSGRILILPTDEENAAINAGIAADSDTYELSDADFKLLRPGRPPKPQPKISTTIRLDADVLTALKATGPGWQTRLNGVMRDWLRQHQAA